MCGMRVVKGDPPGGIFEYSGTSYYFCGDGCRRAFEKDPAAYLQASESGSSGSHVNHVNNGGPGAELSPTAPISFTAADDPSGEGKFVDVEYQCVCGCTPGARVVTDSAEAGSEHCCCGRVHFAGVDPERQLRSYMAERAKTDMDADVAPYVYAETEVVTASGQSVAVAYAQPENPRK